MSKWEKAAVKMVTKAGGKMPLKDVLKKLTKKAEKECGAKGNGDVEGDMRAEVKGCSSLVVRDSMVELKK